MFKPEESENAAQFANRFLERYTSIGFGALSKREVDLMIIDLLQRHLPNFKDTTDFDAALMLKSTKRKIRGLRDEVSYREVQDEHRLKERLRSELKRAEVLASDHSTVMVQLDDAVMRGFAEKIVRSEFGIVDSSFNNAIMRLSGEKFLFLAFSVLTEDEREEVENTVNELAPNTNQAPQPGKSTFTLFKESFISGAGSQAGKLCVSGAMAMITGGASVLFEGTEPLADAGRSIGTALQQAWTYFTGNANNGENET